MANLAKLLEDAPVLVEGAMGTMLMRAGLTAGAMGEEITLERPEVLADVHAQYVAAGARVLVTNTFNANRLRLVHGGLVDRLGDCNRRAVEIARQQAGETCAVAGSIGPTGQMLAPYGPLAYDDAVDAFAEQAKHLAEAGADLLMVETMFDLQEALAALAGCRRVCGLPVSTTLSFNETPRGFVTMMGNAAGDALAELASAGATIVGSNCQLSSAAMTRLAEEIVPRLDVPVLIKPNAGQPEADGATPSYPETPAEYATHAVTLARLGVALIGGCCGTTPEFIAAARSALATHRAA